MTFSSYSNLENFDFLSSIDSRGKLSAFEFQNLPFHPKRIFFISEVPSESIRGQHAHKVCEQMIFAIQGSCNIRAISDGLDMNLHLDSNSPGVYIAALTWCELSNFDSSTVLGVFASHVYDVGDYITDFSEFIKEISK